MHCDQEKEDMLRELRSSRHLTRGAADWHVHWQILAAKFTMGVFCWLSNEIIL